MNKLLLVFVAILIISCKKDNNITNDKPAEVQQTSKMQSAKNDSVKLTLETFGFPQEVEGCSCYFAENRSEFVKQNYIYVDDFQKSAFIKINGEQIKAEYLKENEVLPEKDLNLKAESDDYKITVKGIKVEKGEIETALYEGTITVETKDGKKIESEFYGECGC